MNNVFFIRIAFNNYIYNATFCINYKIYVYCELMRPVLVSFSQRDNLGSDCN